MELEQALLRTRAFVSLLRCTGMRSITAVTLRIDQFTEAGNESDVLLLKRELRRFIEAEVETRSRWIEENVKKGWEEVV